MTTADRIDEVASILTERGTSVLANSKDFLERMYEKHGTIHLANLVKIHLRQLGLPDSIVTAREFMDAMDRAITRKGFAVDVEQDDVSRLNRGDR